MTLRDWFLTAQERANPGSELPVWTTGNLAEPLIHGSAYFDRLVSEVEALRAGDHLFFTDWRGDPDERMRPDGPTVAQLVRPGRPARGDRQGPGLALPPRQALLQRGGEPRPQRDGPRGRRRGAARPAGPARSARTTRSWWCCATPTTRAATSRSPAASTCATAAGTTPRTPATRSRSACPPGTARPRPGTTCSSRCAARWSARWTPSFRERWTDPMPLDSENPLAYAPGPAARHGPHPGPAARAAGRPAAGGPHHVQVLRTYPAVRPRYSVRPGRRTHRGPRLHQGGTPGPAG